MEVEQIETPIDTDMPPSFLSSPVVAGGVSCSSSDVKMTDAVVEVPQKTVTFAPHVCMRYSIHISEYSDEEIQSCWYMPLDYQRIQHENRQTLRWMRVSGVMAPTLPPPSATSMETIIEKETAVDMAGFDANASSDFTGSADDEAPVVPEEGQASPAQTNLCKLYPQQQQQQQLHNAYCARGLENRTKEGSKRKHMLHYAALDAVLFHQELHWESLGCDPEPESTAAEYRKHTDHSARVALLMGLMDEQFAFLQRQQDQGYHQQVLLQNQCKVFASGTGVCPTPPQDGYGSAAFSACGSENGIANMGISSWGEVSHKVQSTVFLHTHTMEQPVMSFVADAPKPSVDAPSLVLVHSALPADTACASIGPVGDIGSVSGQGLIPMNSSAMAA